MEGHMHENDFFKDLNTRTIRVTLVDGTQINASVNIDRQPGYSRLSDLISSDREPFLVLMSATIYKDGIENPARYETLFVNKDHILWATPEEQQR
jgi:small nuclear ribonucleoprotein (snRNP)-like protein